MLLHLSDRQLEEIRALEDVLATPLAAPSIDAWLTVVHETVTALFGVGRSTVVLPSGPNDIRIDSPNLERDILDALRAALLGTADHTDRYGDPVLDRAIRRLAAAGVEVWDQPIVERVSRVRFLDMPRFYPEVVRPGRLEGRLAIGHALEDGRAMLHVLPEQPGRTAFREDGIEVIRLLLPAFKAGTEAMALAAARWHGLERSLDVLDEGVTLFRDGAECYRNRALRRLLQTEERRESVMAAAQRCAVGLTRRIGRPSGTVGAPYGSAQVATGQNLYRLSACHMEGGSDGRATVIMVVVRPALPPLPDEAELRERYGLTAREAQVALLLARGRSSREISELLAISLPTARHHAENALGKIGAPGRKAIALRLLADRTP